MKTNTHGILERRLSCRGRRFTIERLPEHGGGWYYAVCFGSRRYLYTKRLKRARRAVRLLARWVFVSEVAP